MSEKTQKQMVQELYQAVIGIPENSKDNGMIGDIQEIKEKLDKVNGRTRGNEIRSRINRYAISVGGGGGVIGVIGKVFDWW